MKALFILK